MMSCQFLFSFAQRRIIPEALLLFHYPFPLSSTFIESHRVRLQTVHPADVKQAEFVQPSKVALCGFASKFSANASFLGNDKVPTYASLFGLKTNLRDQEYHL